MANPKIFLSHVSEESELAETIKQHLTRDFLGLVEIFVSSDIESIAAGANWLSSLAQALNESSVLLVLCSHASIRRPWVNFEVGAAWIKSIPIVPICHSGLRPRELPIPFAVLQAVEATSEAGLKRLYTRIAKLLKCHLPQKDLSALSDEVARFEQGYKPKIEKAYGSEIDRRSAVKKRVYEALADPSYKWRKIARLAVVGGTSEDEVMELLTLDPDVVFGKGKKTGKRQARLKSRDV